jgi:hypothetical protein
MTTGEMAYLVFTIVAFFIFLIAVAYATWRTEGPPACFTRRGASSPDADRAPAGADPARR